MDGDERSCRGWRGSSGVEEPSAAAPPPRDRTPVRTLPLATRGSDDLVLVNPEAAFVSLAGQQEPGARLQLVGNPGLVEPGGPDVAAVVADFDAGDA